MIAPVFDVEPGLQSNFAAVYNNDENEDEQEKPLLEGKEIASKLLKSYERNYMKKFPYEKGQFHQCIPNPYRENEFITVMLVEKSLEYAGTDKSVHVAFRET